MSPSRLVDTELDRHIEKLRLAAGAVGVAVAVVEGEKIRYARGFGEREAGSGAAVDPDTLFQVGSTTKAFTAVALGLLVDEGLIDWDAPIIYYLPGFRLKDPWLTRQVTVRDALCHRSGISGGIYPFLRVMNSKETVRHLRCAKAMAAIRDSCCYSNLMYAVTGQVVQAVSGATWGDFITRRLIRPLRMHRSVPSPYEIWDDVHVTPTFFGTTAESPRSSDARIPNVAMPHAWNEECTAVPLPWRSYENAAPAGGLVSSASEMANWLILHLNGGRFEGAQLLKTDTLNELHALQNLRADPNVSLIDPVREQYALGWRRAEYRGRLRLAHGGGIIGFPAYVALLPQEGIGVVVLSNGPMLMRGEVPEYLLHKAVAFGVFDRLLGEPTRDWYQAFVDSSGKVCHEATQEEEILGRGRLPDATPSVPLDRYAGVYEDSEGESGHVHVETLHDGLSLKFEGTGTFSAVLRYWHHDMFRLHPAIGVSHVLGPQFVSFIVSPLGEVVSMMLFDRPLQRLRVGDSGPSGGAKAD